MKDYSKIKSFAKINLALNIVGKSFSLHKIESIVSFVNLSDEILIREINKNKHIVKFTGIFSNNIGKKNTVTNLLKILDNKKLLNNKKYEIKIKKNLPTQSGLGGGSMNAAAIFKFLIRKNNLRITKRDIIKTSNLVGSDVILGMYSKNLILKSNGTIFPISSSKCMHVLIVKPDFGCSTKKV